MRESKRQWGSEAVQGGVFCCLTPTEMDCYSAAVKMLETQKCISSNRAAYGEDL